MKKDSDYYSRDMGIIIIQEYKILRRDSSKRRHKRERNHKYENHGFIQMRIYKETRQDNCDR